MSATISNSPKSTERGPVLRPKASQEELAALHPIERGLYRVYEFASSIRLAVLLMIWLMIECAIGTRIESTINAAAARYFVYGNTRFHILLALLALNVLFAALIRYPWKRYQTGFLVTHAGLLTILAGSMITSVAHVDALLNVKQGEISDTMIHPDREVIEVSLRDTKTGKEKGQTIPVEFGPLTWGSKIFGVFPWSQGHVETIPFDAVDRSAKIRVTRFIAHCDWRETYVEDKVGMPAVRFSLAAPTMGFAQSSWAVAEPTEIGFIGDQQVSLGGLPVRVKTWKAGSPAELDHFVHASPKGAIAGLVGQLGVTHAGVHQLVSVDELQKGPFENAAIGLKIELVAYMPHAQLDRAKQTWVNLDDNPVYPAVQLRVTVGGQERSIMAFANNPEFSRLLASRGGLPAETLVTFFRADQPTELQLLVGADGELGYRSFSSQACHSVRAALGESYPAFGMFSFAAEQVLASGRPDLEIIPKPVPPGEQVFPAIDVEFSLPSGHKTTATLVRRLGSVRRVLEDQVVTLTYDLDEEKLPFAIRLDDFNEPKQPGTMAAARYESFVTVFDKDKVAAGQKPRDSSLTFQRGDDTFEYREARKAEIKMNHPLCYGGDARSDSDGSSTRRFGTLARWMGMDHPEYTLYQSGITRAEGTAMSTYTVAYDPGLVVKYAGAVLLCTGIFLMFYMGGYFKRTRRPTNLAGAAADADSD